MANKYVYKFLVLFMFLGFLSYGQITSINAPTYNFTQACVDANSPNSFSITFSFSGTASNSLNQFQVQLSNDNFNTVIIPFGQSSPGVITSLGGTINNLSLQQNVYSSNYKIRVVSTANVILGTPTSVPLSAFYLIHNNIQIPLNSDAVFGNVSACGSNYTISITNTGNASSPLFYPYLTYKWFQELSSGAVVQVGTGSSLNVTTSGKYYVETDYGSCNSSTLFASKSNKVNVNFVAATPLTISSTSDTLCQGSSVTLTSSIPYSSGYTYTWTLDNNTTPLPNNPVPDTYTATVVGTYNLVIDTGSCVIQASKTISPSALTASLNLTSPTNLNAGQTLSLIVSTTASSPSYEWYTVSSGVATLLVGEVSNTLLVNQAGTYRVIVKQNSGCVTTKTLQITITSGNGNGGRDELPNLISPDNDGVNDKWVLPSYITSQSQEIKVEILNEYGKQVFITDNYQNDWPDSDVVIPKTNPIFYFIISAKDQVLKQGTITVIK